MKRLSALTLGLAMLSAQNLSAREAKEFTGDVAEDIILALEGLGLAPSTQLGPQVYGFELSAIECKMVPSPRAAASCQIFQGAEVVAGDFASDLIYYNFVSQGATIHELGGVSFLSLQDVRCVRYEMTHGVSKCFYAD